MASDCTHDNPTTPHATRQSCLRFILSGGQWGIARSLPRSNSPQPTACDVRGPPTASASGTAMALQQRRRRRRRRQPAWSRARVVARRCIGGTALWLLCAGCLLPCLVHRGSDVFVGASLTVGSGQEAASETATKMQTTVIRGTFQGGGWKGDPQIGARVYWDNTQKEWLYVDDTSTDEIFENMECAVTQVEREALLDIFYSAGGSEGKWQDQWHPDDYPCPCIFGWHGIKCDRYGAVKEINLAYNGLVGSLPASMQNLQSLTLLAVNSNDLTGPFPEINATSLEVLYIHNTYFTSIPNSIAYLPRLDTYFSQTFDNNELDVGDILNGRERELKEQDLDELCTVAPGKHRDIRCDPVDEVREKERVFGETLL